MTLKYTRITSWQESEEQLKDIRHAVFVEEQGCPAEQEWDQYDAIAIHFLVKDSEDQVYACARMVRDHHSATKASIGRFAVYPQYRRQGITRQLVKYIIAFARSQGIFELTLSAQTYVTKLYQSAGFETLGNPYDEVGIPHVRMSLLLGQARPETASTLGEDPQVHRFNKHEEYLHHLIPLLQQARHKILILSQDLEKKTLDHPTVLEAISALARRSRSTFVQIIIENPKIPRTESNQLLALCKRLTTAMEIKVLPPILDFPEQVFVLVDDQGVILRHSHQNWQGFCCYYDPGTVKRLTDEFNRLLGQAHESQELHRFSL